LFGLSLVFFYYFFNIFFLTVLFIIKIPISRVILGCLFVFFEIINTLTLLKREVFVTSEVEVYGRGTKLSGEYRGAKGTVDVLDHTDG
jgi:hypothetical protein